MARSTVEIFNMALSWLGGEQLSSVESAWDSSALGVLCKNNFPSVLDEALSSSDWSFATRRCQLALKPVDDSHPDYAYCYGLPTDCLRPIRLISGANTVTNFCLEGQNLLTNIAPAQLSYVSRCQDPRLWSPIFATALSWGLAAVLATARLNDQGKQQQCLENYQISLAEARARDRNISHPPQPSSLWLQSRGTTDEI